MTMPNREAVDDGVSTATPVVKRTALGEVFHGAIIRTEARSIKKRDDNGVSRDVINPATGKPRQELVVHCITMPGTTALAGIGDDVAVPTPGHQVRVILRGQAYSKYIEAKKAMPGGRVLWGDVITQVTDVAQCYDANGNVKGQPITTQAQLDAVPRGTSVGVYGPVTLRSPAAGDEQWVTAAGEAYTAWKTGAREAADVAIDEDPF